MNIPEGAQYINPNNNHFYKKDSLDTWFSIEPDGNKWGEFIFNWDDEVHDGYFIPIGFEQSIPKGVVTSDKLQKLSEESGFQIEFHPDGKVHVWDEVLEACTAGTLDEVIELAEAKIEYAKVWAKFTWS